MHDDENRASDAACRELLEHVLQDERAWMDELAPGGVPSPMIERLVGQGAPTERPLREQWLGLLGDVLWDVFSDNNDVVGPDGVLYDLGSFRGSGGFLADVLNERLARERLAAEDGSEAPGWRGGRSRGGPFDYIDFYMGTMGMLGEGPDGPGVRPFYVRVFERLRDRGCDWHYAPPALSVFRFPKPEQDDDPATYDPSAALAAQAEEAASDAGAEALARDLAESNAEAFERAVREPPLVVRAYAEVYGAPPRYIRH